MAQNNGGFSVGRLISSLVSLAVAGVIFYAIYLFFGGTPESMASGLLDMGRAISEWIADFARSVTGK